MSRLRNHHMDYKIPPLLLKWRSQTMPGPAGWQTLRTTNSHSAFLPGARI